MCCGKRKSKSNDISKVLEHRPTERITERVINQLAEKCPPDCDCEKT